MLRAKKGKVEMTMITFGRSGGVSGNPINYQVDLNNLPSATAKALLDMIHRADFFNIPEDSTPPVPVPDEFKYTIIVEAGETDNHGFHVVHTSDTAAPKSLRPLIDALSNLAHVSLA